MRQVHQIVVDGCKSGELGKVEGQSNRDLCDTIVANIKYFQVSELWPADLFNVGQLVLVEV